MAHKVHTMVGRKGEKLGKLERQRRFVGGRVRNTWTSGGIAHCRLQCLWGLATRLRWQASLGKVFGRRGCVLLSGKVAAARRRRRRPSRSRKLPVPTEAPVRMSQRPISPAAAAAPRGPIGALGWLEIALKFPLLRLFLLLLLLRHSARTTQHSLLVWNHSAQYLLYAHAPTAGAQAAAAAAAVFVF